MNRKRKRSGALIAAGVFLAVIAAIAILIGVFRIRSLNVVGNSRYAAETLRQDLIYDFQTQNTLYFAWKYKNAGYESRTPYLSSVQAKMTGPGAVTLTVKEKKIIGYVQYSGSMVSFDSEGMVLDISDKVYDDACLVTGVTMEEPVLYQKLPLSNTALLRTMLSITKLMSDADLTPDSIEFDDNLNITIRLGSVNVEIGQDEYLEEKVANLETIYPQISSQTGILNMSGFTGKNETITFKESDGSEASSDEIDPENAEGGENTGESGAEEGADLSAEDSADGQEDTADTGEETAEDQVDHSQDTTTGVMVFDSSGTLRYDAHISGGQVVDSYGNVIDGCSVTEEGYIKDAYWNVINPQDGSLMNG